MYAVIQLVRFSMIKITKKSAQNFLLEIVVSDKNPLPQDRGSNTYSWITTGIPFSVE